jgi:hypothetical protein
MTNLIVILLNFLMKDFCQWSKQAEWWDGQRKTAFIANDWKTYIRLYLQDKYERKPQK